MVDKKVEGAVGQSIGMSHVSGPDGYM